MTPCTDLAEFYRLNNSDLIRILYWKGISDPEHIKDVCQSFYYRVARLHILERYDPALGPFESFILSVIQNVIIDSAEETTFPEQESETPLHEIYGRIREFRGWLRKHAGRQSEPLLKELEARVKGKDLKESSRSTYFRYVRRFLNQ